MKSHVSDFCLNQICVNWGVVVLQKNPVLFQLFVCGIAKRPLKILNELKLQKFKLSKNIHKILSSFLIWKKPVKIMVDFLKKDTKRDFEKWVPVLGYRE